MSQKDAGNRDDLSAASATTWSYKSAARGASGIVPFRSSGMKIQGLLSGSGPEEHLPERYLVREGDQGSRLRCLEAPGLEVSIYRSYAFSETEARKMGEGIIFLDGAGQFQPTLDHDKKFYNLDHHDGCVRAFTLATCEQALVLVLKGLELDRGDWKIFANEPDLDTVFAIWVLLNHRRVRQLPPQRRDALVPLLRLEGAIDANGFDIAEFCGLPLAQLEEARAQLDRLHGIEMDLKRSGHWGTTDLADYTSRMLGEIDQLVYLASDFEGFTRVEEEYGHVEIDSNRVAVVCRDSSGIYEVEKRLKRRWGDRLGIIALEADRGVFTLRRTASLTGIDLAKAYQQLNLQDPAVNGRPPENRWGGSDDIGGSPRPSGTALSPSAIGRILFQAYRPLNPSRRLRKALEAILVARAVSGAGVLGGWLATTFLPPLGGFPPVLAQLCAVAISALLVTAALTYRISRKRFWLFGWRRPAGKDWYPLLLLAALGSGATLPAGLFSEMASWWSAGAALILLALALETGFRGLIHGTSMLDFRVQRVADPWILSVPVLLSALLYALAALAAWAIGFTQPLVGLSPLLAGGLVGMSALIGGLSLGIIRERSLSLWPGVIAQLVGWLLALFLVAV